MHGKDHANIGPNSIIQTVHALYDMYGEAQAVSVLKQGGQGHLVEALPEKMIHESHFHSLVEMLVVQTGSSQTEQILHAAGTRTADYLLSHRIPPFFQRLVRTLPRRTGLRLLLWAIGLNAWTFVGSGQFQFTVRHHPTIHVRINYPSFRPVAHFYGGTFTHLVHTLIDQRATFQISTSYAAGGIDCMYTLNLYERQTV